MEKYEKYIRYIKIFAWVFYIIYPLYITIFRDSFLLLDDDTNYYFCLGICAVMLILLIFDALWGKYRKKDK